MECVPVWDVWVHMCPGPPYTLYMWGDKKCLTAACQVSWLESVCHTRIRTWVWLPSIPIAWLTSIGDRSGSGGSQDLPTRNFTKMVSSRLTEGLCVKNYGGKQIKEGSQHGPLACIHPALGTHTHLPQSTESVNCWSKCFSESKCFSNNSEKQIHCKYNAYLKMSKKMFGL